MLHSKTHEDVKWKEITNQNQTMCLCFFYQFIHLAVAVGLKQSMLHKLTDLINPPNLSILFLAFSVCICCSVALPSTLFLVLSLLSGRSSKISNALSLHLSQSPPLSISVSPRPQPPREEEEEIGWWWFVERDGDSRPSQSSPCICCNLVSASFLSLL